MSIPRSGIDQNQEKQVAVISTLEDRNKHEVRCGMCARALYVEDEDYRRYVDAISSGLDNPFLCEICDDEYDDLAYEG